ncbi:MAG: threonine synthase [Eubacteriales bacterium]
MKYVSTRGTDYQYSSAQAIKQGIAPDGGLFVPESIPKLSKEDLQRMTAQTYIETTADVLSLYLDDYSHSELLDYCTWAYDPEKFGDDPAPLVQLNKYNDREYILELWHGPTAAFKDMALQLLPYLMTGAIQKTGEKRKICVLAATSGDTGKAALEGFKDVPGTEVIVFYPNSGVSEAQRLQMVTTEGDNVHVIAVKGCFDDTQSGVKRIFADEEFEKTLKEKGVVLSSANSINWGRLVPQIAYYVASYAVLLRDEKIAMGEPINVVVPTGNFGNILAAWYAMKMGVPINKLICASNRNKVLSDFLRSGTYDRNRDFYKTNSPSMDILISSNLERLLFEITGKNGAKILEWMGSLSEKGVYTVDPTTLRTLQNVFVGGFADEAGIIKTIREIYDRCDHVIDTHTAVGFNVYGRYYQRSADETKTIFISTASPFKFADSVLDAIFGVGYSRGRSAEVIIRELSEESSLPVPAGLSNLSERQVLHDTLIEKDDMQKQVLEILSR